jgi:hypothetical protein
MLHRIRKSISQLDFLGHSYFFPELAFSDTAKERNDLLNTSWKRLFTWRRWKLSLSALALCLLLEMVFRLIGAYIRPWLPGAFDNFATRVSFAALKGGILGLAVFWLLSKNIRMELRKEMSARGYKVCMGCGYNLRGLESPQCPECGTDCPADQSIISA